jgi:hypothetical protein
MWYDEAENYILYGILIAVVLLWRISDADFSTAQFSHPNAFAKSITTEGQLVGMLTDDSLRMDFINAFFDGRYSIRFKRTDVSEDRTYYIEQAPDADVLNTFAKCLRTMAAVMLRVP